MLWWQGVSAFLTAHNAEIAIVAMVVSVITTPIAAVSLWVGFWRWRKRKALERRYRLSGNYISVYSDSKLNETPKSFYAASRIKQSGARIDITSTETDGRPWKHEGMIIRDRHIAGSYSSGNPFDSGAGTFLLQIGNRGELTGHWHGYEHQNQEPRSGEYKFFKLDDSIRVEKALSQSYAAVLDIADSAFGKNYLDTTALADGSVQIFVAIADGKVVGFSITILYAKNKFFEKHPQTALHRSSLDYCNKNGLLGVIKTVAVDNAARRRGIGTILLRSAEDYLAKKGATAILLPVWMDGKKGAFENIAKGNGYSEICNIADYWKSECDAGNFVCIAKTGTSCVCNCTFFLKCPRTAKPRSSYLRSTAVLCQALSRSKN